MATDFVSSILRIDNIMKPAYCTNSIEFQEPYFNNIFSIPTEYIGDMVTSPMFGDEMDLKLWKWLKLRFGSVASSTPLYTLQAGYRYIYNHVRHTFSIFDGSGVRVFYVEDVDDIADFHVDFTVIKSHQFEVVFNTAEFKLFFIPAYYRMSPYDLGDDDGKTHPPFMDFDSNKDVLGKADSFAYRLSGDSTFFESTSEQRSRSVFATEFTTLHNYSSLDNKKAKATSCVYDDSFDVIDAKHKKQLFRAYSIRLHMLYSTLLMSLLPSLQPTQRVDETHNNRPVYEPWLIYGLYRFLYNRRYITDEDTYPIDIMDLSPNWAY